MDLTPLQFDPTTLVTFIFRAPAEVRTVELLGSWDNFNIPYRMHNDRRRGSGFWSGCFKFENIIFDGWNMQWSKPRSGGLRQGGTYWYYYRLNYDMDSFDDRQPSTTNCPLLPGQKVNVLDVPTEVAEPLERCRSACADIIGSLADLGEQQTLDPQAKFATVDPPPASKVHARSLSDAALKGRLESQPVIIVDKPVSPVSQACSPRTKPADIAERAISSRDHSLSAASSVYSQGSAVSEPVERDHKYLDETIVEDTDLPTFPYPNTLGAAPLASSEALGAVLFPPSRSGQDVEHISTQTIPVPRHHDMRKASELSLSPPSVHNVQFYGSRPGTNLTEDPEQHRPRMYSLPNLEIGDYAEDSAPASPTSDYSPQTVDMEDNLTPEDETSNYAFTSPTFSAATISTGGHTTPFRLSAQNSLAGGTYVPTGPHGHDMEDIVDRLRALAPRDDDQASVRSIRNLPRSQFKATNFVNYSLPTIASESNQSLVKTTTDMSASPRSRPEVPMPTTIYHEGEGTSIADDIFEELGFLSGSIA